MAPQPHPAPPQQPDADLVRLAMSPTWDDIMAVLRSDKMRGYRIDVETDATVMQDAEADKQSRIEFTKAAGELLTQAYQAMTVAPQMLPVIKEMFMFAIRGFHAGRSMEETFEDAFDELAKNMPKAPGPAGPDPAVMGKLEIDKQRLLLDTEKMKADAQAKQGETAAAAEERQMRFQLDVQKLQADRAKAESDAALKNKELDIQARTTQADLSMKADQGNKDYALRVAEHHRALVTEAVQQQEADSAVQQDQAPQGPDPSELIAQLAQAIVQGQETQAQAQRQLAEAVMAAQQAHGQQVMALATKLSAPKRVVRGPDGRAMGVETVG